MFIVREEKIDSRKKIYKILSQYNTQEFPVFKTYKTADIITWVTSHAKKKKDLTLEKDAIEFLVEQVGNDLRQFDTELDKLKLILYFHVLHIIYLFHKFLLKVIY